MSFYNVKFDKTLVKWSEVALNDLFDRFSKFI